MGSFDLFNELTIGREHLSAVTTGESMESNLMILQICFACQYFCITHVTGNRVTCSDVFFHFDSCFRVDFTLVADELMVVFHMTGQFSLISGFEVAIFTVK